MTTLREHIEDLDVDRWAALTKRAATAAVEAAQRHGHTPPPDVAAVAAMSERELIDHRNRTGPAPKRLSPVMQLVQADHLRAVAEQRTRAAEQAQRDADAAAQLARAEAEDAARAADDARERARAAKADASHRAVEHAAELRRAQAALEDVRAELERTKADAATEIAAAHEQARAADERAHERAAERREDRESGQQALEELRAELERVRADATAEVAAAQEQARAADARAEQRLVERAEDHGAAQQALEELRGELEQVRADAAAEVAGAQGRAQGEIAAAEAALARTRQDADVAIAHTHEELDRVRAECAAQVAAAREQVEQAVAALHAAQAETARARAEAEQIRRQADGATDQRLLAIPVPPADLRAHTGSIEDALAGARDLDYVLETALSGHGPGVDAQDVRALTDTVQRQARELTDQLQALSARYSDGWRVQAAQSYAAAASHAYGGLLARIATAVQRLAQGPHPDPAVIASVTAMLDAHPWRRC